MPSLETQLQEKVDAAGKIVDKLLKRSDELDAMLAKGDNAPELKAEVAKLCDANFEANEAIRELRDGLEAEKAQRLESEKTLENVHTLVKDIRMNGAGQQSMQKTAGQLVADALTERRKSNPDFTDGEFKITVPIPSAKQLPQPGETKDITDAAGSGEDLLIPTYRPGIIGPGVAPLTMRSIIPGGTISGASYVFFTEATATDGAEGQTPQGALKGESDLTFTQTSRDVVTIATYLKASTQILDDVAALASYINGRGSYFVNAHENEQLLEGDGTAGNLNGIIPQATAYDTTLPTQMGVASITDIDHLRAALYQINRDSFFSGDAFVLNPFNWTAIELIKTSENAYLWSNPQGVGVPTMWGVRVVQENAIDMGSFLAGAFAAGSQLFDRKGLQIALATQNEDDFIRNLVTIRFEKRMVLAVYRPAAFVTGSLSVGSGS